MQLVCSFLATLAVASLSPIGASAQLIQACVNRNGVPRIVTNGSECDGKETLLTWNQQGLKGDEGDPGEPGEPGPPGPTLRVFDGAGNVLGIGTGANDPFNEQLGMVINFNLLRGAPAQSISFQFTQPHCGGQAYVLGAGALAAANTLFGPYPPTAPDTETGGEVALPRFLLSRIEVHNNTETVSRLRVTNSSGDAVCEVSEIVLDTAIPADAFTGELPFTIPVPDPIYVGLAP